MAGFRRFHMTSLKFKLQNYWSCWYFTLMMCKSSWKLIFTNFCSEWVLGFAIGYAWISKLLRDAAFTWRPSWLINVFEFLERQIYAFVTKLSDRCFCWFPAAMLVPIWMSTNMASHTNLYKFRWHTSANSARIKNSRDLILGEVVYIAIIYHIPDSWI